MTKNEILKKIKELAEMQIHFEYRSTSETIDEYSFKTNKTEDWYEKEISRLKKQASRIGITEEEIDAAYSIGADNAYKAYHESEGWC